MKNYYHEASSNNPVSWGLSLILVLFLVVMGNDAAYGDMPAIEWLEFQVPPQEQAAFITQDRQIWDSFLSQYSGFQGKEVWQPISGANTLILVIHWSSYDQWKAIPPEKLSAVTDRFHRALGKVYPIVSSKTYRVLPDP